MADFTLIRRIADIFSRSEELDHDGNHQLLCRFSIVVGILSACFWGVIWMHQRSNPFYISHPENLYVIDTFIGLSLLSSLLFSLYSLTLRNGSIELMFFGRIWKTWQVRNLVSIGIYRGNYWLRFSNEGPFVIVSLYSGASGFLKAVQEETGIHDIQKNSRGNRT